MYDKKTDFVDSVLDFRHVNRHFLGLVISASEVADFTIYLKYTEFFKSEIQ